MKTLQQSLEQYLLPSAAATLHGDLAVYELLADEIVPECERLYQTHHLPLKTITAFDERQEGGDFRIMYVFGVPEAAVFLAPFIRVKDSFPSLTPAIHEASGYERKIKTFFGLTPVGHPDPRSLILHENWPENAFPLRKDSAWNWRPEWAAGEFHFRELSGEGIYEIPVGPVHAGIIEPGHFRFSMAGEEILQLEPRLGYSHKGTEKLFETVPLADKLRLAERVSGDSSFSHALAFCQAVESLAGVNVPARGKYLRVIFAELERLANHFGDIGAIMTDTGFNFGGAQGGRLREAVMQWNERLTSSRFLRGVAAFGGVNIDINEATACELDAAMEAILQDFTEVMAVANDSSTLLNRLKTTGTLDKQVARDHGVVGVAGRAVGFAADARKDFAYAAYDKMQFELATEDGGDVHARFHVRVKEVFASIGIIRQALRELPSSPIRTQMDSSALHKRSFAIGLVEGWRGDIVYLTATDASGQVSRVDVRDPSFLNWTAISYAARGNVVPDFPLINKSFNLSYSGNDL